MTTQEAIERIDAMGARELQRLNRFQSEGGLNFRVYGDRRKTADLRYSLKRWVQSGPSFLARFEQATHAR